MDGHRPGAPRARLVLIGPMGAGKTSIGKRVAKRVNAPFRDSDAVFVAEHGPITAFFDEHGEPAFRRAERAAVARSLREDAVVALGGGAVLHPETRADVAELAVVLLLTSPETVAERIGNGKRPLVRGGVHDWVRILEERRALYESLATLTIDTSHRPITVIADEVARWMRERASQAPSPFFDPREGTPA